MAKIDLNTLSFEDMNKQLANESDKADFWYERRMGGEDKVSRLLWDAIDKAKKEGLKCAHNVPVTWESPDGNKWAIFKSAQWDNRSNVPSSRTNSFMYQEDGNVPSMLMVMSADKDGVLTQRNANRHAMVLCGHFFEQFCTRFGVELDGLNTIVAFMERYFDTVRIVFGGEYQNKEAIAIVSKDIVCLGTLRDRDEDGDCIWNINTCIRTDSLTEHQHKLYDGAVEWVHGHIEEKLWVFEQIGQKMDFVEDAIKRFTQKYRVSFPDVESEWTFWRYVSLLSDIHYEFFGYGRIPKIDGPAMMHLYTYCTNVLKRVMRHNESVPVIIGWMSRMALLLSIADDKKNRKAVENLAPKLKDNDDTAVIAFCSQAQFEGLMKQVDKKVFVDDANGPMHIKLHEKLTNIYQYEQLQIMKDRARTEFIKFIKDRGLKSKFEKEVALLNLSLEDYYTYAESIYVLSRLIPGTRDESTRDKFTAANREWMAVVVDKDYCPQLKPYVEKYSKEEVLWAIQTQIDGNAWVSPVDDKALKKTQDDNFKGLEIISEMIDIHRMELAEEAAKADAQQDDTITFEVETVPTPEHVVDEEEEQRRDENDAARAAYESLKTNFKACIDNFRQAAEDLKRLGSLTTDNELVQMLEADNDRLTKENVRLVAERDMQVVEAMKDRDARIEELERKVDSVEGELVEMEKKLKDEQSSKAAIDNTLKQLRKDNEELKDKAFRARKEKEDAERQQQQLVDNAKKAQQEIDSLKAQLENERSLKKVKRIPATLFTESGFGIGPGITKRIAQLLEGRNVIIDMDK